MHLTFQPSHLTFKTTISDSLISNPMPVMKQSVRNLQKLIADLTGGPETLADLFEVPLQMSPAPLMSPQPVIRLCTVAGGDSFEVIAQKFFNHAGRFRQPNSKDSERCCRDLPDPRILILLSRWCFIGADGMLLRNQPH